MDIITPARIAPGAHFRVIAPSRNGSILSEDIIKRATENLESKGFRVSFGRHWKENDTVLGTTTIQNRLADLHEAFLDPKVDGILTAIGGYNANQLLEGINYDVIRRHPKVFCGFSDITVLSNALFAGAGLITYLGPHFSSWAMRDGFEYTKEYFLKAVQTSEPYDIKPSETWSNDEWFINQDNRTFVANDDAEIVINKGSATGIILGGNISSFCRLMGTKFKPSLQDSVLLLEQGDETNLQIFDADLETLIQQNDFSGVKAIIIGRFPDPTSVTTDMLLQTITSKEALRDIPIVANINLGHTTPVATFAIGGKCDIHMSTSVEIRMISH